ncbi:hypothetical protein [Haloferax chudinovii]|uniref:Uncharacterized protein n=1 Tax=Haloferax chudinovii TaxID=1109010 RepID=A0ABD5XLR6_9EURY
MVITSPLFQLGPGLTFIGLCFDLFGVILLARPDSNSISRLFSSHRKRKAAETAIKLIEAGQALEPDTPNIEPVQKVLNEHTSIPPEEVVFLSPKLMPWRPGNGIVISNVESYESYGSKLRINRDSQNTPAGPELDLEEMGEIEKEVIKDGSLHMSYLRNIERNLNQAQRKEGLVLIAIGFIIQLMGAFANGIFVAAPAAA